MNGYLFNLIKKECFSYNIFKGLWKLHIRKQLGSCTLRLVYIYIIILKIFQQVSYLTMSVNIWYFNSISLQIFYHNKQT